ncbi:Zmym1 [Oopsacas minuta]|uniref:Zmym1 n=1 Tax=Oopsacas minuta TaxID=111878 RepID=A0AAV7JF48_9METZ|nr:Zmym1 [Oopsacas minuta]
MSRVIYVHCFAYRLNLVVVDISRGVGRISDMFGMLQLLHNFLSSSVVHVRYLVAQKFFQPNSRTREIPSLSYTRWICRQEATEVVLCTLPAITSAIDEFAEEVGNRGNNARILLSQITSCFVTQWL